MSYSNSVKSIDEIRRDIKRLQQCEAIFTQWLMKPITSDPENTERDWLGLCHRIEEVVARLEQVALSDDVSQWLYQFKLRMKQKIPEMAAYCRALDTAMVSMKAKRTAAWAYQKTQTMEKVTP